LLIHFGLYRCLGLSLDDISFVTPVKEGGLS